MSWTIELGYITVPDLIIPREYISLDKKNIFNYIFSPKEVNFFF